MKDKKENENICVDCNNSFQGDLESKYERHCKYDKPYWKNNELKYPIHSRKTKCSKYSKRGVKINV